jgi:hypothetical protein
MAFSTASTAGQPARRTSGIVENRLWGFCLSPLMPCAA